MHSHVLLFRSWFEPRTIPLALCNSPPTMAVRLSWWIFRISAYSMGPMLSSCSAARYARRRSERISLDCVMTLNSIQNQRRKIVNAMCGTRAALTLIVFLGIILGGQALAVECEFTVCGTYCEEIYGGYIIYWGLDITGCPDAKVALYTKCATDQTWTLVDQDADSPYRYQETESCSGCGNYRQFKIYLTCPPNKPPAECAYCTGVCSIEFDGCP